VEAAEIMDLLDYSLAAFNPPADSSLAAAYPDIFSADKTTGHDISYDDDDDDDDDEVDHDVPDDVTAVDFKAQSQQHELMMQDINAQSVIWLKLTIISTGQLVHSKAGKTIIVLMCGCAFS